MIAQPFAQPARALVDKLGDVIQRLENFGHAETFPFSRSRCFRSRSRIRSCSRTPVCPPLPHTLGLTPAFLWFGAVSLIGLALPLAKLSIVRVPLPLIFTVSLANVWVIRALLAFTLTVLHALTFARGFFPAQHLTHYSAPKGFGHNRAFTNRSHAAFTSGGLDDHRCSPISSYAG
jgi:hypothetical protein